MVFLAVTNVGKMVAKVFSYFLHIIESMGDQLLHNGKMAFD